MLTSVGYENISLLNGRLEVAPVDEHRFPLLEFLNLDLFLAFEVRGELEVLGHDGQLPGSDTGMILKQKVFWLISS